MLQFVLCKHSIPFHWNIMILNRGSYVALEFKGTCTCFYLKFSVLFTGLSFNRDITLQISYLNIIFACFCFCFVLFFCFVFRRVENLQVFNCESTCICEIRALLNNRLTLLYIRNVCEFKFSILENITVFPTLDFPNLHEIIKGLPAALVKVKQTFLVYFK